MVDLNRTQTALEFDKIKNILAEVCPTDGSKELAISLEPFIYEDEVRRSLKRTSEAKEMMTTKGMPPFGQIKDIRPILDRADKNAVLTLRELLDAANVLRTTRSLGNYIREGHDQAEYSIREIFERLMPEKRLEDRIFRSIVSEDMVADDASPALADIRRKIKQTNSSIKEMLQKYVSGAYSKYLQENIVTQRNGRYVVPVKAEYRSEVRGLVHDTSASGATLFIEPIAVIDANNKLRELEASETHEIERILYDLSASLSAFSGELRLNYDNITFLAFIFGCAQLSFNMDAREPVITEKREASLINARHPLIPAKDVVPVTVRLGGEYSMLVITGPNTGGKTVSLKTLGLLSMMAQSGLHIPCKSGSQICVFDKIFPDIGDEQSIEQSLSTFSAHMTSIVSILSEMTPKSLVLLDELGAGTDPVEGAALATAVLEHILASGALCAATTHYAELKAFAIETPGVMNASCEFDINTLKPTYKLVIGTPGKSMAFAISEHLGLSSKIIERAKAHVDPETREFERVIEKLDKSRFELDTERENARKLRAELEIEKSNTEKMLDEKLKKSEREAQDMMKKARTMLEGARASVDYIFAELDAVRKEKDSAVFSDKYQKTKQDVRSKLRKLDDEINPVEYKDDGDYVLPRPLKNGDRIIHREFGTEGTVISPADKNGYCMVQMGSLKSRINEKKLRLDESVSKEKKKDTKSSVRAVVCRDFKPQIDVRGQTGDDAWFMVDNYIDSANLASVKTVTVLHGKGTGALRKALWGYFKSDPRIASFRAGEYGEGDYGVTVLELK